LRLALPSPPDASLTAHSLNGSVTVARGVESPRADARVLRGKFQTRWGAGGRSVNLFSGRGRISLEALAPGGAEVSGRGTRRGETRQPRVRETPDDAPVLTTTRPRPEPVETPQEVDEDEVVRVESDLVTLNVSVIDRASGRGLHDLTAGDFHVYEDNVEQQIEHFETAEAPFDLLLLLDLSGSTARVTETIRAAARRFVAVTRPQDRVGVIAFAGDVAVVSPLTSDRAQLRSSLDRLAPPKGDTRLHDSLAYALDYMTRGADPSRRRAVIVMSDGLDSTLPNVTGTGSAVSYDEIRSRVQEFDGVVYSVWTNTEFYEAFSPLDIQPETYDLAHDRMAELAESGGGLFYEVEKLEDLAGAYERVVADLGTVYGLSYRPTNKLRDGAWRAIRVRLPRRPEAVARGRRGYFAK
jgi:VWFA-related protein